MISIYIVGFSDSEALKMHQRIVELMEEINRAEETFTTIFPALTQTCIFDRKKPHFVVMAGNTNTCHEVADQLHDNLGQTTLSINLNSCLERKEK